jgi:hypothetical protein
MALAADIAAHLLPRGVAIEIVILHALGGFQRAHALDEARPRDLELHRGGIVTIDACHRMRDQLARLGEGQLIDLFEAFHEVAVAGLLVRHGNRRVAMQAGARLLHHILALGVGLVIEHEGVAALLAEILRKGVAGPHRLQARVFLEARLGHDRARVGLGRRAWLGFASAVARALLVDGAPIVVVLQGKILAPDGRVDGFLGELHHAKERIPRLLFTLDDRDEKEHADNRTRDRYEYQDEEHGQRPRAVKV